MKKSLALLILLNYAPCMRPVTQAEYNEAVDALVKLYYSSKPAEDKRTTKVNSDNNLCSGGSVPLKMPKSPSENKDYNIIKLEYLLYPMDEALKVLYKIRCFPSNVTRQQFMFFLRTLGEKFCGNQHPEVYRYFLCGLRNRFKKVVAGEAFIQIIDEERSNEKKKADIAIANRSLSKYTETEYRTNGTEEDFLKIWKWFFEKHNDWNIKKRKKAE